jgi:hypothetical protein
MGSVGQEVQLLHLVEHPLRGGQQRSSGGREAHRLTIAVEQPHAKPLLEPTQPLGQRRLTHPEPLGGPTEVAFDRDRGEVLQVPYEVHERERYLT